MYLVWYRLVHYPLFMHLCYVIELISEGLYRGLYLEPIHVLVVLDYVCQLVTVHKIL